MSTPTPRLRLFMALGQLEKTADAAAEAAFFMDRDKLTDDEKLLRDYYARLSMSLNDALSELRILASKRRARGTLV